MSAIIDFYSEEGTDILGRTLLDIWQFDRRALEDDHDYIQWLFPLDEPSGHSELAPVLTPEDIATFNSTSLLKANLYQSWITMLVFYGLYLNGQVLPTPSFPHLKGQWCTPRNHNFKRLSRIMKSLKLLGLGEAADKTYAPLAMMYEYERSISPEVMWHWRMAVGA